MTPLLFLALSIAGGSGACARLVLDGVIRSRNRSALPWGTIVINLTGSFALGFLVGMAAGHLVPSDWLLVLGTGFLGGYTTFSTASFETVRLLQNDERGKGLFNAFGTLISATAMAGIGLWAASVI